jgi:hypothetical protein
MSEPAAGPSGPGTVVMELGADIGALILYTPAEMDGKEIEISRDEPGEADGGRDGGDAGSGSRHTHSRVRPRHMPGETRYAAVYPGLPAGRYTVWHNEHSLTVAVTVTGGQVATCRWPG